MYSEISIYGTGFFELLEAGIYNITDSKVKKVNLLSIMIEKSLQWLMQPKRGNVFF